MIGNVFPEQVFVTSKEVTLNDGAGAKIKDLFIFTKSIELVALYGVFTDVTNVVTVSTCSFQVYDATTAVPLTTAAGVDCSAATLGSIVLKNGAVGVAAVFLKSDQVRVTTEIVDSRQFQGIVIVAKNGATNKIQFLATEDANTNCKIKFYAHWIARGNGPTVTPA